MPTKKIFEKERKIVLMQIRSNKTHLSNAVFANSRRASIRLPKLIKLFNSFSELDSLIFWVTIYSIFFVQNVAEIKYHDE